MNDQTHADVTDALTVDFATLESQLDSSAVEEHTPIFEELIEELKVNLDS